MDQRKFLRMTQIIEETTERVRHRYNADNDIVPGVPTVTATDERILYAAEQLLSLVVDLDNRVQYLESLHKGVT